MKKEQLIELFENAMLDVNSTHEKYMSDFANEYINSICCDDLSKPSEMYRIHRYKYNLWVFQRQDKFFIGLNSIFIEILEKEFIECTNKFEKFKIQKIKDIFARKQKKDEEIFAHTYNDNVKKQKRTVLFEKS